jgi:hypothetical protein
MHLRYYLYLLLQAFNSQPGVGIGEVQLEQARAILLSGDLQHAYDTAVEVLNTKATKEVQFAAHALCGLLCHAMWAAHLQSGAPGALAPCYPLLLF